MQELSAKPVTRITSIDELREIYNQPAENAVLKEVDILDQAARDLIALSPFVVFATTGDDGVDCSPKGGEPGFVHVLDEKTLVMPDYPGNNRIDGLQNIVRDPRAGIIFFVPGLDWAFRVNGEAWVTTDEELMAKFTTEKLKPRTVIGLTVGEAYVHCGKAIARSGIWELEKHLPLDQLPKIMDVGMAHVTYSRSKRESAV